MVGVLRIEKISYSASNEDVKSLFRVYGVCPEDIHWLNNDGRAARSAFLAFRTNKEIDQALKVNDTNFREHRVSVLRSTPIEFNTFFPSKPLFSRDTERTQKKKFRNKGQNDYGGTRFNNAGHNFKQNVSHIEQDRTNDGSHYNSYKRNIDDPVTGSSDTRRTIVNKKDSVFDKTNFHKKFEQFRSNKGNNSQVTGASFIETENSFDSNRNFSSHRNSHHRNNLTNANRINHRSEDRTRSRSPVGRNCSQKLDESLRGSDNYRQTGEKRDSKERQPEHNDVNEKKFLRITGLSYKVNINTVKDFFHPHVIVNAFLLKFSSGLYAGKLNGSALVEFHTEEIAQDALGYDGMKLGSRTISVFRAAKDDIVVVVKESVADHCGAEGLVADVNTLNALANTNPEVQHLVGLLNAAVTNLAARSNSQQQQQQQIPLLRKQTGGKRSDDPVINRVASSANINVDDIKNGRVVGMRNLPYSVTPDVILNLFRSYHPIQDSVRIHYLDNGRCSGDAIICFGENWEARRAVRDLNKKIINNRKVELFFL